MRSLINRTSSFPGQRIEHRENFPTSVQEKLLPKILVTMSL
ncbi:unnamed protein product, partial [Rotaria sp. Silwood1]